MDEAANRGGLYHSNGRFNADRRFEDFIPVGVQHGNVSFVVAGIVDPNLGRFEICGRHRSSIVNAAYSNGIHDPAAVFHIKIIAWHEASSGTNAPDVMVFRGIDSVAVQIRRLSVPLHT